jgi:hypothetical protein
LIFVEGHALNKGTKMLVDAEALEVLCQGSLDALVEGREVGSSVLLDLTLKTVELLLVADIGADLHTVVVDLGVDSGALNDHAALAALVGDVDGEVAVVLSFGASLVLLVLLLLIRELLIIGDWLSTNKKKKHQSRLTKVRRQSPILIRGSRMNKRAKI